MIRSNDSFIKYESLNNLFFSLFVTERVRDRSEEEKTKGKEEYEKKNKTFS